MTDHALTPETLAELEQPETKPVPVVTHEQPNDEHTPASSRGDDFADHCVECSEAANEWVSWPCSREALVKAAVEQDRYVRSMDEDAERWRLMAERDAALAEVAAVRKVHEPVEAIDVRTNRVRRVCTGCGTDAGNWAIWPCATIRALGGKR